MSLLNYFSNPHIPTIKKYLFEILKNKYSKYDKFIDRFCTPLTIKEDAQSFVELIGDVYQNGYVLAVNQHKDALSKIGMEVKIQNPVSEKDKIFNQKNQDALEME